MLEIIAVIFLCKRLGAMLREKGRKPLAFQIMLVISWIGAELLGGVVAGVLHAMKHGPGTPFEPTLTMYALSLGGALLAATFVFLIAKSLRPLNEAAAFHAGAEYSEQGQAAPTDPNNPFSPPRA